jgi:hypothetical protein
MDLQGLENFLIKESKIDKKFIIDFFGFQKKILYKSYEPKEFIKDKFLCLKMIFFYKKSFLTIHY